MILKFNDYALINGHPRGGRCGVNPPWEQMWAWSTGFVDICCQFLAQDGGLDCFCNFIAESLRKRPQLGFVMHQAEMAGRENNNRSIENVNCPFPLLDLQRKLNFIPCSRQVQAEARLRSFLKTNQIVICVDLD